MSVEIKVGQIRAWGDYKECTDAEKFQILAVTSQRLIYRYVTDTREYGDTLENILRDSIIVPAPKKLVELVAWVDSDNSNNIFLGSGNDPDYKAYDRFTAMPIVIKDGKLFVEEA